MYRHMRSCLVACPLLHPNGMVELAASPPGQAGLRLPGAEPALGTDLSHVFAHPPRSPGRGPHARVVAGSVGALPPALQGSATLRPARAARTPRGEVSGARRETLCITHQGRHPWHGCQSHAAPWCKGWSCSRLHPSEPAPAPLPAANAWVCTNDSPAGPGAVGGLVCREAAPDPRVGS